MSLRLKIIVHKLLGYLLIYTTRSDEIPSKIA